jgi:hypothetical protein
MADPAGACGCAGRCFLYLDYDYQQEEWYFLVEILGLGPLYHGLEKVDPDAGNYSTTSGMEKRADVPIHLAPSDRDGRLLLRQS